MNLKYLSISLVIHLFIVLWIFSDKSSVINPRLVQIGVDLNIPNIDSFLKKKIMNKKNAEQKTNNNHPLPSETNLQNLNEDHFENDTSSGRDSTLISQYASQVAELIDKNKYYPIMAKRLEQEGEVLLNITIDKHGNLLKVAIERSCSFDSLNLAAVDAVHKVQRFPPIPEGLMSQQITFTIPIEYLIN